MKQVLPLCQYFSFYIQNLPMGQQYSKVFMRNRFDHDILKISLKQIQIILWIWHILNI